MRLNAAAHFTSAIDKCRIPLTLALSRREREFAGPLSLPSLTDLADPRSGLPLVRKTLPPILNDSTISQLETLNFNWRKLYFHCS
jgi:hypothetical protein